MVDTSLLENLSFGYRGDLGSLYDLVWARARHPLLYEATGAYFVSPTGIVSFVRSTTCIRSLPAVNYIQNTNQPFISTDTNISVLVDEIVAYTFDNFYQRHLHYIFHRDGDRLNCSWSNLRVCHTLDDHRSAYIDVLRQENPERTFAPIQHMDATYSFSRYFVSDLGEVFTLNRNRLLAPYKNECGYYRVCLTADTTDDQGGYVKRKFAVHRLVWAAFKGTIPHDQFVDHKNGKRYDNRLVNLRLATPSENLMYSLSDEQTAQRMLEVSDGTRAKVMLPVVDETTEWRPIGTLHGYSAGRFGPFSLYEVSENGCVRRRRNMDDERLLDLFFEGPYHTVTLYLTQEQKQRHPNNIDTIRVKVHVLVAHAFVEGYGIKGRTIVDHKDGDKTNNDYSNLRWVTPQEKTP
ncbi:predicted protein [Lichtheimia corymbifera JMRC:FSU:9682]|uniref:HNH nuclease domain-containing protein n=1 Tax=Lichtheimia corymbifera JMRC:FSU:9682 TaxID=1263082 RepID=A0A068RLT3_9FUNG|nr:predicted protein [Lichtheimia corymbifera JMRC:FSU:9682]